MTPDQLTPELLDVIELLVNIPDRNLQAGTQGTIVECHTDEDFEIEFSDDNGETLALFPLSRQNFIVVWKSKTQQPVNPVEIATAILEHLPQDKQTQVLDYARGLYQNA